MSNPLNELRMRQRIARFEKQQERRLARQRQEQRTNAALRATDESDHVDESEDPGTKNLKTSGDGKEMLKSKNVDAGSVERYPEQKKHRKEQHMIEEEDDLVEVARMLDRKKGAGSLRKRPQLSISSGRQRARQRVTRHDDSDSDEDLMAFFRKKPSVAKGENGVATKVPPSRQRNDSCSQDNSANNPKKDPKPPSSPGISMKAPCSLTKRTDVPNVDPCPPEKVEDPAAASLTPSQTTWEKVQIIGSDGNFHIEKNAMGVPGFHVAVNVFSAETHRQLFDDSVFTASTVPFVQDQAVPLRQAITHPTKPLISMHPWPENWHRLINAVRDSELFPSATIPDCGYALTYDEQSIFPPHHDGRGKWGEYVIVASFGAPVTVTFQHGAPKRNPVDSTRLWNWTPPPTPPGSYFLRSQTERPDDMYKRKLWQVSMILPPNSIYVMSGPSRYDWRHGINWHGRDGVPPLFPSTMLASTYPGWNTSRVRRAVVFRSTKIFCDLSLEIEEKRSREAGDSDAVADLVSRRKASARFKYDAEDCRRKLNGDEIAAHRAVANEVLSTLARSGAHRLRFCPDQVHYDCSKQKRAVADPLPNIHSQAVRRGENVQGPKSHSDAPSFASNPIAVNDEEMQIRRAIELSLADETRDETRKHADTATKFPNSSPDVICLDDSDDEGTVSGFNDQKVAQNLIPKELVKWASNHCKELGIDVFACSQSISGDDRKRAASSALPGSAERDDNHQCFFDGATLVDMHPKTSVGGGWIWVRNSSYKDRSAGDIESFKREWLVFAKRFLDSSPPKHHDVLSLAEKHGVLYGKWLLRVSLTFAPELWTKIRDGMLNEKLGPTAKISQSAQGGENTLIVCVYVPDFRDKAEVLRIRRALHYDIKVYTKSCLYFKPDCFTHIDLFHRWKKFRKSIYSCGGETKTHKDLECSTLIVTEAKCTGKKDCPQCYPSCLRSSK